MRRFFLLFSCALALTAYAAPHEPAAVVPSLPEAVTTAPSPLSLREGLGRGSVYPIPQQAECLPGDVAVPSSVTVVADKAVDAATRARAEEVLREAGLGVRWADKADAHGFTLRLSVDATLSGEADGRYDHHVITLASTRHGALLTLVGQHTNAVFFGLATIEQVLVQAADGVLPCFRIDDWADQQIRGIVEGYYGYPYAIDTRIDLMEWGKRYKMNTFIYGPKGDPYHLGWWRRDYPLTVTPTEAANGMVTQADLRRLAEVSAATKVNFIWAAHPAFSDPIDLSTRQGTMQGVADILRKYDHLHSLGIRQFGLFLDDISVEQGVKDCERHALLLRSVQDSLVCRYNHPGALPTDTVRPLQFVPTPYCFAFASDADHRTYFSAISTIQPEINVYFTGNGVWSNIVEKDFQRMKGYVGREVAMWWNYPCNDNNDRNIYLLDVDHYYQTDPTLQSSLGIVCNPMAQGEASKIGLFGVMDYGWNVKAFRSADNWEHAFAGCVADPALAAAYRTFAPYAVQAEPSALGALIDRYMADPTPSRRQALSAALGEVRSACATLRGLAHSSTPSDALLWREIHFWVDKLYDMCALADDFMAVCAMDATTDTSAEARVRASLALADRFAALADAEQYTVVQKESAGTSNVTSRGVVTPSARYLMPFIEWLRLQAVPVPHNPTAVPIVRADLPEGTGIYAGRLEMLYDADAATFLWTNGPQHLDDCYTFTLADLTPVRNVRVTLMENDRMREGTVELSADASQWTAVGTVAESSLRPVPGSRAVYADVPVDGLEARYVRFRLSEPHTGKWFKMADIEVASRVPALDALGRPVPVLFDGDLFTSFVPTQGGTTWTIADATAPSVPTATPRALVIYQDPRPLEGLSAEACPFAIVTEQNGHQSPRLPLASSVSRLDLTPYAHPRYVTIYSHPTATPILYEVVEEP